MPDSGSFSLPSRLVAACIQTNATADIQTNLTTVEPMIIQAAAQGAQLITLPENVSLMIVGRERLFAQARPENDNLAVAFFSRMAKTTSTWMLAGSIAVAVDNDRLANRSYLFNPEGQIVARYDKIHMFDAELSASEVFRESANFRGGDRAVLAQTPWGKIGMTICYDLRFPHLHRALAKAGASIITIPAAFIATTGRLHWHILVRARAIETGCFVIAPGQCGEHDGGRRTYGHSLIVAPSGEILAEAGEETGIIMADLDLTKVADARRMLPSLKHDCEFARP
jgi:predicted amidohydrolase